MDTCGIGLVRECVNEQGDIVMRIMFRFRWVPFVAAIAVAAAGTSLGQWQTRRALEKESIAVKLTQREAAPPLDLNVALPNIGDAEYRRVAVRGEFLPGWPVYLDNRPYGGMAGFYVLMPFKIAGSDLHVLVARGWAPRDPNNRLKLPAPVTPRGQIEIRGVVRHSAGHLLQLGALPEIRPNAVVQNLEVKQFAQASRLNMLPVLIEQTSDTREGLVRDWPKPSSGSERNRGYAFQWYALAATAFLFFVVTGFRRGSK
jgi:surfeit locus 1 family protein